MADVPIEQLDEKNNEFEDLKKAKEIAVLLQGYPFNKALSILGDCKVYLQEISIIGQIIKE